MVRDLDFGVGNEPAVFAGAGAKFVGIAGAVSGISTCLILVGAGAGADECVAAMGVLVSTRCVAGLALVVVAAMSVSGTLPWCMATGSAATVMLAIVVFVVAAGLADSAVGTGVVSGAPLVVDGVGDFFFATHDGGGEGESRTFQVLVVHEFYRWQRPMMFVGAEISSQTGGWQFGLPDAQHNKFDSSAPRK